MLVRSGADERLPRQDALKRGRAASEYRGKRTDTVLEEIADVNC